MTEITLKSKHKELKAILPDGWHELKMKDYIKILKEKALTDLKFISIVTGIEESDLEKCETKEMLWLILQLRKEFSQEKLDEISKEHLLSFEYNGITYKVNPDLCTATIGEYNSLVMVEQKLQQQQWSLFPLFLAMLYRTENEEYDHEKCNARAKEFEELTVDIYFRARNFFLFLQNQFKTDTEIYGEMNKTQLKHKLEQAS